MAHPADVTSIVALVNGYASDNVMLPMSAERVTLALDDFVVAVDARGRARYPEKVRRDCASCPRRSACNEICVARMFRADTLEFAA